MTIGYLPPFALLRAGIEASPDGTKVSMSRSLFNRLVAAAAIGATFDDVWYRTEYMDVAEAVEAGDYRAELDHFSELGYEEGRMPAYFEVDEEWYLQHNPDVARAIASGDVLDAETHFNEMGYHEGRTPDAETAAEAEKWFAAISESAEVLSTAAEGDNAAEPDAYTAADAEPERRDEAGEAP